MKKQVDVAIIGTGTAALAAASEVQRATQNFVIISNGVYGTTCVRAGRMPSKAFILGAQLYHTRHRMQKSGIHGTEHLQMDIAELLMHVRAHRDHFLHYTLETTQQYKPYIVEGDAWFLSCTEIRVDDIVYSAKRVVLATGSSPIIPEFCANYSDDILTSDTIFEQETLPATLGVMGMSVLGTEMAQAFARLGIHVIASHDGTFIGGLTDPIVNDYALHYLSNEMEIRLTQSPEECLQGESKSWFVAQSRKANLEHMGLEDCGICQPGKPVIDYNPETMQLGDLPVFVAGDVKLGRSILNEATDEGKIAGYNATHSSIKSFKRRTPLQITYTDPTIAIAGKALAELDPETIVAGHATYDNQGRAKIMGEAHGIIRLYADKDTYELLGAELFAPAGEHLAHMLAWITDQRMTEKKRSNCHSITLL